MLVFTGLRKSQRRIRYQLVRGELDWLSRKARARTRKAQARIDEAQRLQDELQDLDSRSKTSAVGLDFSATERKTKRLVVAEGLGEWLGLGSQRGRPAAGGVLRRSLHQSRACAR